MSPEKYAIKILERFDMTDCKSMQFEQKLDIINNNTDGLADSKNTA